MEKPKKEEVILYSLGAVFALFITLVYGIVALVLINYINEFVVIAFSFLPFACFVSSKMISYVMDIMDRRKK